MVTLTTDFGLSDSYLAEVKAVLLSAHGNVRLVDVTHLISPFDISSGAFHLLRSYARFPKGTFHLAVIDPGVGTTRKAIYVKTENYHFVGPDNGLLLWAVRDCEAREGKRAKVFEIALEEKVAPTFHARDVFAPFIGKVLKDEKPRLIPLEELQGEEFPGSRELDGRKRGEIVAVDNYGNMITSIPVEAEYNVEAQVADKEDRVPYAKNYEAIEEKKVALIEGSHGFWELAANQGSAWEILRVGRGTEVTLYPIPSK